MNIFESITAIMQDIPAIGKDKKNQQQGFKYRGIDDVMNALQPILSKHKVFVVPEVMEQKREERVTGKGNTLLYSVMKVKYTFYAEDGTSVFAVVIGEGMDSGDKASNKAMAIAMKYAFFQVFCIPTEEMKDPDSETPEPSKPKTQELKPAITSQEDTMFWCEDCTLEIKPTKNKDGPIWKPADVAAYSKRRFGRQLCPACQKKAYDAEKVNQE